MKELSYKDVLSLGREGHDEVMKYLYIDSKLNTYPKEGVRELLVNLAKHVKEVYDSEQCVVNYHLKHAKPSIHNEFWVSLNPYNTPLQFKIVGKGDVNTLNYLVSVLHEVGHVIDALKRGVSTFTSRDEVNTITAEIQAWKLGLRFGLVFGYLTKEDVEFAFGDCMLSLATYYRDSRHHGVEHLEKAIVEIREYIYS